jgi:hypothetical protein
MVVDAPPRDPDTAAVVEDDPFEALIEEARQRARRRRRLYGVAASVVAVAVVAGIVSAGGAGSVPGNGTETDAAAEPPGPWSPELRAHPMDPSISGQLAVSPDGTLVGYDPAAATLTWYENEPRVVTVTAQLTGTEEEGDPWLAAIGPDDVAYFQSFRAGGDEVVAVAPSGTEITRVDWTGGTNPFVNATASGLIATRCAWIANRCTGGSYWPPPNSPLVMPWVDVARNPITDTRPYPTANDTEAGVEVRLGEQEWLLEQEQLSGHHIPDIVVRSDGGLVMLLDETFDAPGKPLKLLELLPDSTTERYVVPFTRTLLPDGSVIVEHNSQLIRLTPPT